MRKTTHKILLCLYSPDKDNRIILKTSEMRQLLPSLSDGGYRSLMKSMADKRLIQTTLVGRESWCRITDLGRRALESQIWALSESRRHWDGQWEMVLFLQPPKNDQSFRYLRTLILETGGFQLGRGMYLFPGGVSPQVRSQCLDIYLLSVSVFRVSSWEVGDPSQVLLSSKKQSAVLDSYSGISSEISELLQKNVTVSSASGKQKNHLSSVLDRIVDSAQSDHGLSTHLFPQVSTLSDLVEQFQQFFTKS